MNQAMTCSNCGMFRHMWSAEGEGFALEGEQYCCRGCAEEIGCRCEEPRALLLQPFRRMLNSYRQEEPDELIN